MQPPKVECVCERGLAKAELLGMAYAVITRREHSSARFILKEKPRMAR